MTHLLPDGSPFPLSYTTPARQARNRYAALARYRDPEDPAVVEARAALDAENAKEDARRLVADWPKLTPEARAVIAANLRPALSDVDGGVAA